MSEQPPGYYEKYAPYDESNFNSSQVEPQVGSSQQHYLQQNQGHYPSEKQESQELPGSYIPEPQTTEQPTQIPFIVVQHISSNIPPEPKQYGKGAVIGLYIISCIIPPIATGVVSTNSKELIINLTLFVFAAPIAIFQGIYLVHKYTAGECSHQNWEEQYGFKA